MEARRDGTLVRYAADRGRKAKRKTGEVELRTSAVRHRNGVAHNVLPTNAKGFSPENRQGLAVILKTNHISRRNHLEGTKGRGY